MRFVLLAALVACSHAATPPAPKPTPVAPVAPVVAPAEPTDPDAPSWVGVRFDQGTTRVIQVVPGAPAERAGVRIGDELTAIDGHAVHVDAEAVQAVRGHRPGITPIAIKRGGADIVIKVAIAPMPDLDDLPRQTLVDKPAPAFSAQPIAGGFSPVLADLAGNVVIVDFWATWCGPCAMTMPVLDRWQTQYRDRGLRIVGLTDEDVNTVRAFLAADPLSYAIARDADDHIGQQYMRFAVPMLVVIDRKGVVRFVQVGAGDFDQLEAAIVALL